GERCAPLTLMPQRPIARTSVKSSFKRRTNARGQNSVPIDCLDDFALTLNAIYQYGLTGRARRHPVDISKVPPAHEADTHLAAHAGSAVYRGSVDVVDRQAECPALEWLQGRAKLLPAESSPVDDHVVTRPVVA